MPQTAADYRRLTVAARLPPVALGRLRAALGSRCSTEEAPSWRAFLSAALASRHDVAVIDPSIEDRTSSAAVPATAQAVLDRLTARPAALERPIVIYVPVSAEAMRAVAALVSPADHTLVLHGYDDEPRRLRRLIEEAAASPLVTRVLGALAPELAVLPPPLARAVSRMLDDPAACTATGDLAAAAGMTRRTADRWLARGGLAPANLLLAVGEACAVHDLQQPRGTSAPELAERLGFTSVRAFDRHLRRMVGRSTARLRSLGRPDAADS